MLPTFLTIVRNTPAGLAYYLLEALAWGVVLFWLFRAIRAADRAYRASGLLHEIGLRRINEPVDEETAGPTPEFGKRLYPYSVLKADSEIERENGRALRAFIQDAFVRGARPPQMH